MGKKKKNAKTSGHDHGILSAMKVGDWLIIATGVILSVVTAIAVWLPQKAAGGMANVYVNGALIAELPLGVDTSYKIAEPADEDYINVLEIVDGRIHMSEANCNDAYCIRQGFINHTGDAIICLPHRVVVEIAAGEVNELDAIAG